MPYYRWTLGLVFSLLAFVPGCATLEHGTTQVVTIQPDPADAVCTIRQGQAPEKPVPPDGKVELARSRESIAVECTKDGYKTARTGKMAMYSQKPFGGLSFLVDVSSGANYSYPPVVKIALSPTGS